MLNCGIYEIVNRTNGHRYIGSSSDLDRRHKDHKRLLARNKHHSAHLQHAWNFYLEDQFDFNVLIYCDENSLLTYEQMCIDRFNPVYNTCPTAGSMRGFHHSEETRKHFSELRTGKNLWSEERRNAFRERVRGNTNWAGRKHTPEAIEKIRVSHLGNTYGAGHSPSRESRERISRGLLGNRNGSGSRTIRNPGDNSPKLCLDDVVKIRALFKEGHLVSEIAVMFGVSRASIHSIVNEKSWKANSRKRLTANEISEICKRKDAGERSVMLATEFGVDRRTINRVYREAQHA